RPRRSSESNRGRLGLLQARILRTSSGLGEARQYEAARTRIPPHAALARRVGRVRRGIQSGPPTSVAMKIAILGTRGIPANYGGFETCAEQLSERWAAWGHNVVLYARKDRYEKRPTTVNGVSVRYTSSFSLFGLETPSAAFLATLNLIFRGRQFRWIHLYNTGNAFLLPLLRALGFRVVVSVDGIEWRRKKWGW